METSRIVKNDRAEKRKINQETQHTQQNETAHIKIPQNQCTDSVVGVSVAMQRKVSQNQPFHRVGEAIEFGLDFRYGERA